MADKPKAIEDEMDEVVVYSVQDEAVWILQSTWSELVAVFPAAFRRQLLEVYPRDGRFIVIPKITWALVSLMQQRSTRH